jgi:hypothetical protein
LGAGGWFVKLNGRVYEAIQARHDHRRPQDLHHTALEVYVPEGRYVIENSWPIPDDDVAARGVVIQGPVFDRRLSRFRPLRYEIRRWRDGIIADAAWAICSPQLVSDDVYVAAALLDLVPSVPVLVWGRDDLATGEMWNSNSVIAWALASAGLRAEELRPPCGGRAPGWSAGLAVAGGPRTDRQPVP